MTMEFRQLRYFVAVAETLSFTAAAQRLNVSQPPVSRQIALLEDRIGVRLLERTRQRVQLTAGGSVFYDHARALLAQAEAAVTAARRATEGHTGKVVLGFGGSTVYLLPNVLAAFRERFPAVQLMLQPIHLGYQLAALRSGDIDFGLVVMPIDEPALVTERFASEAMVAALPSGHPLSSRAALRLADLAECQFVMVPWARGFGFGRHTMRICRRAGFVPKVVHEAEPMESVVGLVAAGAGVAIVPQLTTRLPIPGVEYRPFRDRFAKAEIAMAWRRNDPSPALRNFVEVARAKRQNAVMTGSAPSRSRVPSGKRR